jgi:AbrB family looped-hinge helix DNA binding protein
MSDMKTKFLSSVVTMGQRGTIVVPAEMRKALGLDCGSTLLAIVDGDQISLVPAPSDPMERLAWAGKGMFSGSDADTWLRELRDEWDD